MSQRYLARLTLTSEPTFVSMSFVFNSFYVRFTAAASVQKTNRKVTVYEAARYLN